MGSSKFVIGDKTYKTIINNLNNQGGLIEIDEENFNVKVWPQDMRLIKPVPKIFLSKLCDIYGFTLVSK